MNKICIPCLVGGTLFFTGCATTSMQVSPEVLQQREILKTELKTKSVALLSDSCLLRSELGTSHVAAQQSRQTAEKLSAEVKDQFNQYGVDVIVNAHPFLCGYMPEQQLKKYDIKYDVDGKRQEIKYPVLNDSELANNQQQNLAILHLYQAVNLQNAQQLENARYPKKAKPIGELNLTDDEQNTLKTFAQSPYLVLVSSAGVDVSFGKNFLITGLSAGIAVATLGAGSPMAVFYMPAEGQTYTLNIVDLDKKKIVHGWSEHLPNKVFAKNNHDIGVIHPLWGLFETAPIKK